MTHLSTPTITTPRTPSDLTVTDVFCGAGGNTIGAKAAGLRVRVGLNHWERAVETYGTNNPDVDVIERVDVSLCDPRRYPTTDIGIFSPECTTHSPAGGNRHQKPTAQRELFERGPLDAATVRSRVTMFDVVRFTEYHRYRVVIVENVVEATRWELFEDWLTMMDRLGYQHRILSLNSMFFHPTPQSRDRIYVVFWQRGNRAPDLEYRPPAPCGRCGVVHAVQVWNPNRRVGKYRRQYRYACPRCAKEVTPFYYAALNALDFSLPAERIGDREKPLKPRTMERIRFGLEKYGRRTLVVNVKQGARDSSRAWPADVREMGTVPTWDNYFGVAQDAPVLVPMRRNARAHGMDEPVTTVCAGAEHHSLVAPAPFITHQHHSTGGPLARGVDAPAPTMAACGQPGLALPPGFLVETAQSHSERRRPRDLREPLPTMGAQLTSALVSPFFVGTSHGGRGQLAHGGDPLPSQTTAQDIGVVQPFVVKNMENNVPRSADKPLSAVCTGEHHMLVQGAAQISLRDVNAMRVAGLDAELMTQGCAPQQALIARAPFLASYYGTENVSPGDAPVATVTTLERHAAVQPGVIGADDPETALRVEDCYFRMLQPHEIGRAMAFPDAYQVGGTKRDRVKQYGNAVTPPVMDWIVQQCSATLAPEIGESITATEPSTPRTRLERAA